MFTYITHGTATNTRRVFSEQAEPLSQTRWSLEIMVLLSVQTPRRGRECVFIPVSFFFMHHVGFISRSHLAALSPPGSWTVPPLAASWNTAFHTFWPATRRPGGELQDVLYFYIHIYNAVISVTQVLITLEVRQIVKRWFSPFSSKKQRFKDLFIYLLEIRRF